MDWKNLMWTIFEKILSFFPRFVSWWLYREKKTKSKIKVRIDAQEGCCDINCGEPPNFTLWVEISNGNSFPLDIDRIIFKGSFGHSAQLYVENLIGGVIASFGSERFILESYIEPSQVKKIKASEDGAGINYGEIKLVLSNKYYKMRYIEHFERIRCGVKNK